MPNISKLIFQTSITALTIIFVSAVSTIVTYSVGFEPKIINSLVYAYTLDMTLIDWSQVSTIFYIFAFTLLMIYLFSMAEDLKFKKRKMSTNTKF